MGFVKVKKEDVQQQQLFESDAPKPKVQHTAPEKRSKFTKLGKAEEVFTRTEREETPTSAYRHDLAFRIPSARGFVLPRLTEIEDDYMKHGILSVGQAKILRLCGHVRYLRNLLDQHNIPFEINGATLSEKTKGWNPDVEDSLWASDQITYERMLNQQPKPLRFVDGKYVGDQVVTEPEDDDELLKQVQVFDHSGEVEEESEDDTEDEEEEEE